MNHHQNSPGDKRPTWRLKRIVRSLILVLCLSTCFPGSRGLAQESKENSAVANRSFSAAVNEANQLVRDKKLNEALTIYSQLRLDHPEHALLNLNTGIAEFENGQFSAAKDSFTIASFSEDSEIAAKARYNLGNCFYAQALQSQSSDQNSPPDVASAIESLQTAIQHYRRALRIQRDLPNARHNIELAVRLIDQLRQQQPPEQQQQNQQQQNQQSPQNQESGEQEPGDSTDSGDPTQDPSEQEPTAERKPEENQQQSSDTNNREAPEDSNSSKKESSKDNDSSDTSQEDQNAAERERDGDQQNSDDEKRSDAGNDSREQREPNEQASAEDPEQANHEAGQEPSKKPATANGGREDGENEKSSAPPEGELTSRNQPSIEEGELPEQAVTDKPGQLTREEALKLLQSIRDRDMQRRLRQKFRQQRRRRVPVKRDW